MKEEHISDRTKAIVNAIVHFITKSEKGVCYKHVKEFYSELSDTLDKVRILCYRDDKTIPLPKYGHYEDETGRPIDACCDLICKSIFIKEDGRIVCGTGLHIAPDKYYNIDIVPNSRITKQGIIIPNSPSIIDESYRGEMFVVYRLLVPFSQANIPKVGEVIAQCRITFNPQIEFVEVDNLEDLGETKRGSDGFGSTANNNK